MSINALCIFTNSPEVTRKEWKIRLANGKTQVSISPNHDVPKPAAYVTIIHKATRVECCVAYPKVILRVLLSLLYITQ
jgi:hypothetical protein